MTANHGSIRDEDVLVTVTPCGDRWRVTLVHQPTLTRVEAVDRTDLLASNLAWIRLRDKLEELT